jgi:hypothetical protein
MNPIFFHLDGIWGFPGADYAYAAYAIGLTILVLILSRTFMEKV